MWRTFQSCIALGLPLILYSPQSFQSFIVSTFIKNFTSGTGAVNYTPHPPPQKKRKMKIKRAYCNHWYSLVCCAFPINSVRILLNFYASNEIAFFAQTLYFPVDIHIHVWCYVTTQNVQVVVEGFWCYTRSFNVPCHCRPSLNTGTSAIFMVMFRSRQNQSVVHWGLNLQQKDDSLKLTMVIFTVWCHRGVFLPLKVPSTEILLILGYFLFPF